MSPFGMNFAILAFVVAALLSVVVGREIVEVEGKTQNERDPKDKENRNPDYGRNFCYSSNKECPGEDIYTRFAVEAKVCVKACIHKYDCVSAFYDQQKICHLRANRCTLQELVPAEGGMQLYRLKKDEVCSAQITGEPLVLEKKWSRKFCVLRGKRCPNQGMDHGSLYRNNLRLHPELACLMKCAKLQTCAGVDYHSTARKQCDIRVTMCADEDLVDDPNAENYIRLPEGEDTCPDNRGDEETPDTC